MSTLTLVPLKQALIPTAAEGSTLHFSVGEDWSQGRSLFGGVQAAMALAALRTVVAAELPLRALQVTFAAPVPPGAVQVSASLIRAGKNVTLAEARILGEGGVACLVIGTFGAARASSIQIAAPQAPTVLAPEGLRELPLIAGMAPNFLHHFPCRFGLGLPPFCGGKEAKNAIWLRHREPTGHAETDLVALADVIPSPTLQLLKKPAPASSLTWMLELLEAAPQQGEGWWRMDSEATSAADGYIAQTATLYTPQGRAVALSRQSVVVFG